MKNYLTSKVVRGDAEFTSTPFPKKGVSLQSKRGFTPTPMHIGVSLQSKRGFTPTPMHIGVSLQSKRGFTLIELLVVIAIIGLLSSVVLASLNSARAKARDARRLSDVRQMQLALELYYDDNGQYPMSGTSPNCSGWAISHPSYITCWDDLKAKLSPYLSTLPLDPLNGYPPTYSYNAYHYRGGLNAGQGYYILMDPEVISDADDDGCYASPWHCSGVNWN
jgi:type II secretion system protein G